MNTFELTLKLQGYNIKEAEKYLEGILKMPAQELYDWQDKKRWEIFNYHVKNNELYNHFVGDRKIENWEDIPILTKQDLQQPIDKVMTKGYSVKDVYYSSTSGSSGHPFTFVKDKFTHALSWALIKNRFSQYDVGLNSKQVRFYGIPLDKSSYRTEKIKDYLSNRIRFQVFDLSENVLDGFIETFRKNKITYIYGYTSSMVYFANYLLKKSVNLYNICPTLKVCIVTSELCIDEDKLLLEKAFGIKVAIEYGSSELSVMGFENPEGDMVCSDEITFFENAEQPDGTTKLLCTSLFNKAMPLIRYSIGDSVEFGKNQDGRNIITKINGRVNDFAKLPSGKVAAGFTFYYVSRSILESTGCLKEFIVRQTSLDTFVLDVVATQPLTEEEIKDIEDKMEMYLEPGLNVVINYVDEIAKKANGKIQHFYNELTT